MKLKTLKDLRDAAPFKPFEILLADGQPLKVLTPDHLVVFPAGNGLLPVETDNRCRTLNSALRGGIGRNASHSKRSK